MTQREIVSLVLSRIAGGIETDERTSAYKKIVAIINVSRGAILPEVSKKSFRSVSSWQQVYEPVFDPDLQETPEFTVFYFPDLIRLDSIFDGNFFIGSRLCSDQFRALKSRGEYYGMKKHRTQANSLSRYFYYLIQNQRIEIYHPTSTRPEKFRAESIFFDPTQVPSFNVDVDDYPMDQDSIPMMLDFIKKTYTMDVLATTADTISDSRDDTKMAQQSNTARR